MKRSAAVGFLFLFVPPLVFAAILMVRGKERSPWDTASRTARCHPRHMLPDPACTPGAVFPGATKETVCVPGYSRKVRHVTEATKRRVLEMYGVTPDGLGDHEIDHLIPLELGGTNDISNLWPEPAAPEPGYRRKDLVENRLHRMVCTYGYPLKEAQRRIAENWFDVEMSMEGAR